MISFIRIQTQEEIKMLAELASEIWHEFFPCILKEEQIVYMVQKFQSIGALQEQIQSGYQYYIIAYKGEKAGYFGVCPQTDDSLFLSKLYVKKEFRGNGIARIAFKKILEIARNERKKFVWLTVNKYNTQAIKVYQHFGMQNIRSEVKEIGEGFVMDDYVFSLQIT